MKKMVIAIIIILIIGGLFSMCDSGSSAEKDFASLYGGAKEYAAYKGTDFY